jgi:hypothetical protein
VVSVYWAKSNGQRRREHMPAATMRRAGRMSEAGGSRTTEQGTFRLAGNESTVSGFPFSRPERQAGWGFSGKSESTGASGARQKAARLFRTDRSGKRFSRRQEVRRVVSVTGRTSNGQRRREHMPASTVRRAGRMSEAGVPEQRSGARSGWPGTNQPSAVFPSPTGAPSGVGFLRKERINRSQRGAAKAARRFRMDRSGKRFNRRQEVRRVVSVTGRHQMIIGGGNICQWRPCGAPDVCPKQGFPNNGARRVPVGRERINRQRFSLLQPEQQPGWGFSERTNQTEPAGRGKKPRGFFERTEQRRWACSNWRNRINRQRFSLMIQPGKN